MGVEKTVWSQPVVHWFCEAGAHVRVGRPESLLRSLQQSQIDNSREELIPAQTTVDVLVLDDVMLKPAGRAEHRDIYQIVGERDGGFSTLLISNRDATE